MQHSGIFGLAVLRAMQDLRSSAPREDQPSLDDPRWRADTLLAPRAPKWVIWNHGGGRRIVGTFSHRIGIHDDIEAWMPFRTT